MREGVKEVAAEVGGADHSYTRERGAVHDDILR